MIEMKTDGTVWLVLDVFKGMMKKFHCIGRRAMDIKHNEKKSITSPREKNDDASQLCQVM